MRSPLALALVAALTGLVVGLGTALPAASPAAATPGAGVLAVGDSVLASISAPNSSLFDHVITPAYPDAVSDAWPSRCTINDNCVFQGQKVVSGLTAIKNRSGTIGDVILIELGYNDCCAGFGPRIDAVMTELTRQDVPTVLWVTMSTKASSARVDADGNPIYAANNAALASATLRWPTLRIADWDTFSAAHPEWFLDGVHLTSAGRSAFALFLKSTLDELPGIGVPPPAAKACSDTVAIGRPTDGPAPIASITSPMALYAPVAPVRLLDSRAGRPLGAGRRLELQVTGRSGVPVGATGVAITLTAVGSCGEGFVTAYPCDGAVPLASNLNTVRGGTVANFVVARLGAGGRLCLFSSVQTNVLADLAGYLAPGAVGGTGFAPHAPTRVLDTRDGTGGVHGPVAGGAPVTIDLVGRGIVPVGTTAVALGLIAVGPVADGYVSAWPCNQSPPTASVLNYTKGSIVPGATWVRLDPDGRVCVSSFAATDLVADVTGSFIAGGDGAVTRTPQRLLDTRSGAGRPVAGTPITLALPVLPDNASGAILNVTTVDAAADGHLTVWPCGTLPNTSNGNYTVGSTRAVLVALPIGAGKQVCLQTSAAAHIVVDLTGWFTTNPT